MIARGGLFATLFIFASLNGLAAAAAESVIAAGWQQAIFDTFGVSVIVWGAWASASYLALLGWDADRVGVRDIVIACIVLLFAALPEARLSWLGVALLSGYVLCTSPRGSAQWRSAAIFCAICVPMLWGPLLLMAWPLPLLTIDAFLVGSVTGAKQSGNVVTFLDGAHTLQIWPPCSSFHNISQAGLDGWRCGSAGAKPGLDGCAVGGAGDDGGGRGQSRALEPHGGVARLFLHGPRTARQPDRRRTDDRPHCARLRHRTAS